MNRNLWIKGTSLALGCALYVLSGCTTTDRTAARLPIAITSNGVNAVSVWDEIAANTINIPPAATGTANEKQPHYALDMATVHIAIYDAVIAIAGTHKPFAVTPTTPVAGASMDAAASAAAYGVLKGLFPARSNVYQAAYDSGLDAIPASEAKSRGVALGSEVARGVLALRARDGRDTVQAPYMPGTTPGKFRGINPAFRFMASVKPFALTDHAQFRAAGPPAIGTPPYAKDFNETKAMGSAASTVRSVAQTEVARFHSEPPNRFWTRNLHQFASSQSQSADNARLMASMWVALADATIACFDSKYHFDFWRPTSAIQMAEPTHNPVTLADAHWQPIIPTPNHPEYPAAHSCVTSATAHAIRRFFGTNQVSFKFASAVPGTVVHSFVTTDDLVNEIQAARIHGGMHFRTATTDGAVIGEKVARWVMERHFQKRN